MKLSENPIGKFPDGLENGQVAFLKTNVWMCITCKIEHTYFRFGRSNCLFACKLSKERMILDMEAFTNMQLYGEKRLTIYIETN